MSKRCWEFIDKLEKLKFVFSTLVFIIGLVFTQAQSPDGGITFKFNDSKILISEKGVKFTLISIGLIMTIPFIVAILKSTNNILERYVDDRYNKAVEDLKEGREVGEPWERVIQKVGDIYCTTDLYKNVYGHYEFNLVHLICPKNQCHSILRWNRVFFGKYIYYCPKCDYSVKRKYSPSIISQLVENDLNSYQLRDL